MTEKEWEALRNVELRGIDRSTLVPMEEVTIDPDLPHEERLEAFLKQIRNPYCFLCGGTPVKLRFAEDGEPLEDVLRRYFTHLKQ